MHLEIDDHYVSIIYEQQATVETISIQKQNLVTAIESGKPIYIILESIELMDIESFQLLLSFNETARKKNLKIKWGKMSKVFRTIATTLGASKLLKV